MHRQSRMTSRLRATTARTNADRARGAPGVGPGHLERLQRAIGNQAIQGLSESLVSGVRSMGVAEVLRSPGRPLPPSVQADMEARFGQDFGDVEIHLGDVAER
jgi:hypothetical protein